MKHSKKIALVLLGSVAMTSLAACNEDKKTDEQASASKETVQYQHGYGSDNSIIPAVIGYLLGKRDGIMSTRGDSSFRDEEERRRSSTPVIVPSTSQPGTTAVSPPTSPPAQPGAVSRGGFGSTANAMSNAGS
jgi:uncharacterized protein YgiB involved in biofilm formation